MSSPLAPIATAFFEAFSPLEAALGDPILFRLLIRDLGWDAEITEDVLAAIPLASSVPAFMESGRDLLAAIDGEGDDAGPAVVDLLGVVDDLVADIAALEHFSPSDAVPDEFKDPAFWADLALLLPGVLIARWLESYHPVLYRLLHLAGVVTERAINRSDGTTLLQRTVDWGRLGGLLSDPAGELADLYRWGEDDWDHDRLLEELRLLLVTFRKPARRAPVRQAYTTGADALFDPASPALPNVRELILPFAHGVTGGAFAEAGLDLVPAPADPAGPVTGLYVTNLATGSATASMAIGDGWTLRLTGDVDATGAAGIVVDPAGISSRASVPDGSATLELGSAFEQPVVLFGAKDGLRLELRGAQVSVTLDAAGPELVLRAAAETDTGDPGLALVLDPGDADSLVRSLAEDASFEATLGLDVAWSSKTGVSLSGSLTLEIPVNRTIGPLTIDWVTISVGLDGGSVSLGATVTFSAVLGPFTLAVQDIGLEARTVDPADSAALATFGDLGVAVSFVPPTGIGLGIDASVASGGGFLWLDYDPGEYAGVFDLQILSIGISAVGLVETKLPDGGWSMFLALFIDVPAIPLGFGFTLNGVGGLVGVNRTLDTSALQDAVRAGSLDAVLFPEDPIADAPLTIDALRAIFPSSPGQYVFGPVVKIGWGSPLTLIEAELGIVIALPDPIVIAVLGSISSVLPEEDVDLIALHLDVAGIIDTGVPSLSLDAGLHDSHVVRFALSGDMALRASFGSEPVFLMALGGFHPGFDAPAGFPALDRLSLAVDAGDLLDIRFDCYLALTSNTLQFGAAFEVSAEVEGFGISGGAEFDALITFSPFHLVTHVGYHVSVTAVGVDLMGVWLDASLEGPNPWRATGTASFKVLGLEQHVDLDVTVGSKKPEPTPPPDDVLDALAAALALPDAWSMGAGGGAGVVLSDGGTAAGELVVAPDGSVGVTQRVVPLALTIDRAPPHTIAGGYDWFDLEVPAESLAASGEMTDWFAPSSYVNLTPSEYLAAPSFEQLRSGLEVGGGDPAAGTARAFTLAYEEIIRDPGVGDDRGDLVFDYAIDGRAGEILGAAMAGGISSRLAGGTLFAATGGYALEAADAGTTVLLQKPGFVARDRLSGAVLAEGASWAGARTSVAGRDAGSVVAPAWEVTA